jgi:3'(2'), 5'-bisphosphate nucleotidase
MHNLPDDRTILNVLEPLALAAGRRIAEILRAGVSAEAKADASPVTAADEAAEALILDGLAQLTPSWPVVAEEAVAAGRVPEVGTGPFWLVDPLDGTKEFLSQNGEFTVNIALIRDRVPVLGVVLAPALDRIWWGALGDGARLRGAPGEAARPIRARPRPSDGGVAAVSRSHLDPDSLAYLEREGVRERLSAGSSLKFCLIAEGRADVYPRFGRTMEWDTAAGHAVLAAAGGRVITSDGADLRYGKPEFENPSFIALGA